MSTEWVADWNGPYAAEATPDPRGPAERTHAPFVAARDGGDPGHDSDGLGVRCALGAEPWRPGTSAAPAVPRNPRSYAGAFPR